MKIGNYSYYGTCSLTVPDKKLFKNWLIAKRIESEGPDGLYEAIMVDHGWDRVVLQPNEIYLAINGWKIWGYWYDDFVQMLADMWSQGVRGKLEMEEEQGYRFEIYFDANGVSYENKGLWRYYAEDEDGCETDEELDEPHMVEKGDGINRRLVDNNGNIQC